MEGMVDYRRLVDFGVLVNLCRLGRVERFGRSSVSGDLLELEMLPFYLASFEESPETYLSPSRGDVWGYPVVDLIYGASGVCTRGMRRYGSDW